MFFTGWKPDYPNPKDWPYKAPKGVMTRNVVDLPCPPVQDQFDTNSCVFKAVTMAMEDAEILGANRDLFYFSALYAYYRYRLKYANVNTDDGAYFRLALDLLAQEGTCRESLWPFGNGEKWSQGPPKEAEADAKNHVIKSYYALLGQGNDLIDQMIACLSSGYGFVGGISLYDSFMSDEMAETGIGRMPNLKTEKWVGGHGIFWKGMDLHRGVFIGRNSWGPWGKNGTGDFEMPLEYLPLYGSDWWTIRMVEG